ncbi:MAG: inositol monophosphatase family protein [Saprospiraceae bacterium]|nr:inositol monophosphatase family protein [Saprospiraceae bacterium]
MKDIQTRLPELLKEAEKAAKKAGQFIREEFGKISAHQAEVKSLNSLVSYVDIGAERLIVDALKPVIPEAGFITEEKTTPNSNKHFNWVIDPLDGTTNFLKGIPVFSVSIALTAGGDVVVGVVYDIMQNWCFTSYKGGGAALNGKSIQVSREYDFKKAVIATGFPYERLDIKTNSDIFFLLQSIIEKSSGIRRLGSAALDLAYVACGKVEGYYEASLNSWDLAAGILLVQEAGGITTDFDDSSNMLASGRVVAANPKIHDVLQATIRECLS